MGQFLKALPRLEIEKLVNWHDGQRRRLRTMNLLERVNQEIKRRTRVARLFPNEAPCLHQVNVILMEKSDDWQTADKRYVVFDNDAVRG